MYTGGNHSCLNGPSLSSLVSTAHQGMQRHTSHNFAMPLLQWIIQLVTKRFGNMLLEIVYIKKTTIGTVSESDVRFCWQRIVTVFYLRLQPQETILFLNGPSITKVRTICCCWDTVNSESLSNPYRVFGDYGQLSETLSNAQWLFRLHPIHLKCMIIMVALYYTHKYEWTYM